MLPGYNHNISYDGRRFHIQTEDYGHDRAVIVTQIFEGGNLVASDRCQYGDCVGAIHCDQEVRRRMQNQHKGMLKALMRGAYDDGTDDQSTLSFSEHRQEDIENTNEDLVPPPSPPFHPGMDEKILEEMILKYFQAEIDT